MIELWERFGYYGMQALIVYFMVQRLGFDDVRANLVWGAAAALIYVSPAIGGWIGDKILGTKRTMVWGAVILTLGYALMAVPTENTWFLFSALGVIVVGNGLFKPNAGNLVRKIFEGTFPLPPRKFLNINIPPVPKEACKGFKVTRAGNRLYAHNAEVHYNPRGKEYYWIGLPELGWMDTPGHTTDFEAVNDGYVSITPIQLDMTAHDEIEALQGWLDA